MGHVFVCILGKILKKIHATLIVSIVNSIYWNTNVNKMNIKESTQLSGLDFILELIIDVRNDLSCLFNNPKYSFGFRKEIIALN